MVQPEYEIRYDITGRPVYLPKQAPAQQDVTSVNGRAGAEAYAMGANSKALLLDATAPILWLKVTAARKKEKPERGSPAFFRGAFRGAFCVEICATAGGESHGARSFL